MSREIDPKAPNGKTLKEFLEANLDGLLDMAKEEGADEIELATLRQLPALAEEICPAGTPITDEACRQVMQSVVERAAPDLLKPVEESSVVLGEVAVIEVEDGGEWGVSNLDPVVRTPHGVHECRATLQKAARFHRDFNQHEYRIRLGEKIFSPLPQQQKDEVEEGGGI
jgi:hypothetical protein